MQAKRAWRSRDSRGAAAVEFALIAPILLMLVFGIISYGFMLSFRQSISQAANEAARAAAVAPASADRRAIAFRAIETSLSATCAVDADPMTCDSSVPATCSTCLALTVTWDYENDASKPKLTFRFALPKTLSYTSTVTVNQVP